MDVSSFFTIDNHLITVISNAITVLLSYEQLLNDWIIKERIGLS